MTADQARHDPLARQVDDALAGLRYQIGLHGFDAPTPDTDVRALHAHRLVVDDQRSGQQ